MVFTFIYLFSHLFKSVWCHRYFLYTWVLIHYYFTYFLFYCSNGLPLAIGTSLSWLLCPFGILPSLQTLVSPYFLALQVVPDSSYMFLFPAQELSISSWSPGFLYWINILDTEIWALGMFIDTGMSFLLEPLSCQCKKTGLCTDPNI